MRLVNFDGAFTFKYSARENTKAWHMGDDVPEREKVRRLNEIIDVQRAQTLKSNEALIGTTEEILVEGPSRKSARDLRGRTDSNRTVVFPDQGAAPGDYVRVTILRANAATLFGVAESAQHNPVHNGAYVESVTK